jgi:hypothetical protein
MQTRWSLAVDLAEQTAVSHILDTCPNAPVEVTLAR